MDHLSQLWRHLELQRPVQNLLETTESRWRNLQTRVTCRIQRAAVNLRTTAQTWMTNLINNNNSNNNNNNNKNSSGRAADVRGRDYEIMTRQFHVAVNACYRHGKISKRELKEAKKKWRRAMREVKKEDKRRVKLWGSC